MANAWYNELIRLYPSPAAFSPDEETTPENPVPATELKDYTLVYDADLPSYIANGASRPESRLDVTADVPKGGFTRVAYLLELGKTGMPNQYAWAAMDAFTDDATKIVVPYRNCGFSWQQKVTNLRVFSNVHGLVTGGTIAEGNVEMWPNAYNPGSTLGNLGADQGKTVYDWDDAPTGPSDYYGSFQVHDFTHQTTVFSYNHFTGDKATTELGIGNDPNTGRRPYHPDWTMKENASSFVIRRLTVFVQKPGLILIYK